MWLDLFDSHPVLTVFLTLLFQLVIVYRLSVQGKYAIRMFLYQLTILVTGFFAAFASIPTYLQNRGGIWAFRTFDIFSCWLDIDVEVRDQQKLECDGQAVIVSNHQSSLDVVGLSKCWPERCTCMVKKSLIYIPGFNLTLILCNSIFVNRFNREKAQEALKKAVETMSEKNLKIWVFPEGTRCRERNMLPFKRGAFNMAIKAQIPVIPVVFSSYLPFYSKEKRYFHNHGQVIAQVLDPISTEGMSLDDAPALADRVRSIMMETFETISKEAEERQEAVYQKFDQKIEVPSKKLS